MGNDDDCAMRPDGCDYSGGPTGPTTDTTDPTDTTDTTTTDETTSPYDNPLYNCGNGGKTNCPGNRRNTGGQVPAVNTGGAGDVIAVVASSSSQLQQDIFNRYMSEVQVLQGAVTPVGLGRVRTVLRLGADKAKLLHGAGFRWAQTSRVFGRRGPIFGTRNSLLNNNRHTETLRMGWNSDHNQSVFRIGGRLVGTVKSWFGSNNPHIDLWRGSFPPLK